MHPIRRRIPALVALTALVGCDGSPSQPGSQDPANIIALDLPAMAFSASSLTVRFMVTDAAGDPVPDVPVQLDPDHGTIEPATATTDAAGTVTIAWALADEDRSQALRVEADDIRRSFSLTTEPEVVAICMEARETFGPGETSRVDVTGTTPTGRAVDLSEQATLTIAAETRTYPDRPVVRMEGRTVYGEGPGTASITANHGDLSARVDIVVGRFPIAVSVTPERIPAAGGTVTLHGYDLDQVGGIFLGTRLVQPISHSAREVVFEVEPAPTECRGRTARQLFVEPAYIPNERLTVEWERDDLVDLEPGQYRSLGAASDLCLRLPAIEDAEFALAFFDTRGLVSGMTGPEDPSLGASRWTIGLKDTSVPSMVGLTEPALAVVATTPPPDVHLNQQPGGALAAADDDEPEDLFSRRDTPWKAGDTFSLADRRGERYPRGSIFHATDRFAVGVLDMDGPYEIPSRLEDLEAALSLYETYGDPLLRNAFIDEHPATTEGSGQMLIVVGDWNMTGGFLSIGAGLEDRGTWVGVDPGTAFAPRDQNLYFSAGVLVHEMAHAFQDRVLMRRCVELGDCTSSPWSYTWAVEGGAEYATEVVLSRAYGFAFDGNAAYGGRIHDVYGFNSRSTDYPFYIFSRGYGAVTWLLRDFTVRAVQAGADLDTALRATLLGSWEGWYGHQDSHPIDRPGLVGRMRSILGHEWDPAAATALAVASIAADDLVEDPGLQVPFLENAWEAYEPALEFELGRGAVVADEVLGMFFGYYRIMDPNGLGGSLVIDMDGQTVEWGIVRIK